MNLLFKNWWNLAIKGVLAIIFGIVALALPKSAIFALVIVFAILAILGGISMIAGGISIKNQNSNWKFWLFEGLLDILIGIAVLIFPQVSLFVLVIFIAAWFFVHAISNIIYSFKYGEATSRKVFFIINGILGVVFVILVMINPFAGAVALTFVIGIFAIITGINAVYVSVVLKKLES